MYDPKVFPNLEISSKDIDFEADGKRVDGKLSKVAVVENFIYQQYVSKRCKYYQLEKVFTQYLILKKTVIPDINTDDKVTVLENGESQSMDVYTAFLKYFKESLDNYYNLNIFVDINKIEDENKTLFYKHMLRTMINTYNSYNVITTTRLDVPKFVKLMIDLAVTILESNKNKKEPNEEENQSKSDEKKTTDIVVQETKYHYKKPDCALPNKVDWKDVLNHLIAKYIRENNEIPD
ncbi:uncharacterized protein LOC132921966 [Rhopalosiphum padi]|uniref:uncharacterized protein LOC132921966 n=1 Tax=Rhopalosiphum padi TaxID=40932 RepID=UPI00298D80BA|nr:uncharacterized protein LOC132921966 [Rhopalosiphum padi]